MAKKSKKIKKSKRVNVIPTSEVKRSRGRPKKDIVSTDQVVSTPKPEPITTPPPTVQEPAPQTPKIVSKLSYQIVLELDNKIGPVVFTKLAEFSDPISRTMITESMTESRQAVERDLQEYIAKNQEFFDGKKKVVYKVMTAGGAQNAFVKKS